jgi:hypothetical protein
MKVNVNSIKEFNEIGRPELEMALKDVKITKQLLELELLETYDDDLLDKIISINKIVKDAEDVLSCKFGDFESFYGKYYPEYIDENGKINEKGLKRFEIFKKRWQNFGKFKKKH